MRAGIYRGLFSMAAMLALAAAAQANELKLTLVSPPSGGNPAKFELRDTKPGGQDVIGFTFQTYYKSSQVDSISYHAASGFVQSDLNVTGDKGPYPSDSSFDHSQNVNFAGTAEAEDDNAVHDCGPLVQIWVQPKAGYDGNIELKIEPYPNTPPSSYWGLDTNGDDVELTVDSIDIPSPAFAKPTIANISTNYAIANEIAGNVTVTITGTNFIDGRTKVQLPGLADITPTVVSSTQMTAVVPKSYLDAAYAGNADGVSLAETLQVFANNNVGDIADADTLNDNAERSEDIGNEDNFYVVSRDKVWVDNTYASASPEDVVTIADSGSVPTIIGANAFGAIAPGATVVNDNGTVRVHGGTQYVENVAITKTGTKLEGYAGASITAPVSAENSALVSVQADDVSITGMDFDVNAPDAVAGVFMGAGKDNVTVVGNTFDMTGDRLTGTSVGFDSQLGFVKNSAVLISCYNGKFTIAGNRIGTASAPFNRGIWTRAAYGTIGGSNYYGTGALNTQGNEIYGVHHDVAVQFVPANKTMLVSHNDFNGWGNDDGKGAQLDFTEPNGGSVSTVSYNRFNPQTTPIDGVSHLRNAMAKNAGAGTITFTENKFNFSHTGFLSANSLGVSLLNNIFTPQSGVTNFTAIEVSNKVPTGGTPPPYQLESTIQGNTFNGTGGVGIEFMNYNAGAVPVGGYYGTQTIGGADALANHFAGTLGRYIKLNNESGLSTSSSKPEVVGLGATPMVPFAGNMDVSENEFNGTLGSAFGLEDGWAAEDKIDHKLDVAALGFVRTKAGEVFVTEESNSIQRGIDAAAAGDTVQVEDHTYSENNITANKKVVVDGESKTGVIVQPATPGSNGIIVGASEVTLQDMTLQNFASAVRRVGPAFDQTSLLNLNVNNNGVEATVPAIDLRGNQAGLDVIESCTFDGNRYRTISVSGGNTKVHDNTFANSSYVSVYTEPLSGFKPVFEITKNTFTGSPIAIRSLASDPASVIGGTTAGDANVANTFNLVGVNAGASNLGVSLEYSPIKVVGNNFVDNGVAGLFGPNIGIYTWAVPSNSEISNNVFTTTIPGVSPSSAIVVAGLRVAPLGSNDPATATFAEIKDNQVTRYATGVWAGFSSAANQSVNVTLSGANIFDGCGTAVNLDGTHVTANVSGSTIQNSDTGIKVAGGAVATVNGNTLTANAKHFAFDTVAPASTVNGKNMADKKLSDVKNDIVADAVNDVTNRAVITVGTALPLADALYAEADTFTYVRSKIQDSINAAPNGGHTVYAMADTFAENITVGKAVHVTGDDAGTIVVPAVSDLAQGVTNTSFAGSQIFVVGASDVEISHLVVDGDNPNLPGGYDHNGANIDARNGIIGDDSWFTGLHVHDCIVKNIYMRAIYSLSAAYNGDVFNIHHNTITNADASGDDIGIAPAAIAARLGNGVIDHNTVSTGSIWTNYARTQSITNNTVIGGGIEVDNNESGIATIANNTVTNTDTGILAYNPGGGTVVTPGEADVFINNNTVSDFNVGIQANMGALNVTHIENNDILSPNDLSSVGVKVSDYDYGASVYYDTDAVTKAVINHNNVYGGINIEKVMNVGGHVLAVGVSANGTGNYINGGIAYVGQSDLLDFSGNYLAAATTNNTDVNAVVANNIDYTPYLESDADSNPAKGFQGDYSHLHILASTDSPQFGSVNRVNEAVALLANGALHSGASRIIDVEPGTYTETGNVLNKEVILQGRSGNRADAILDSGAAAGFPNAAGIGIDIASSNVTVQGLTMRGYLPAINRSSTQANLNLANLQINESGRWMSGGASKPAVRLAQLESDGVQATAHLNNVDFSNVGYAAVACYGGETELENCDVNISEYLGFYANDVSNGVNNALPAKLVAHHNSFTDAEVGIRSLLTASGSSIHHNTFNLGVANGPKAGKAAIGASVEWTACPVEDNTFNVTGSQTAGLDGEGGSMGVFLWNTNNQVQSITNNIFTDAHKLAHAIVVGGNRPGDLGPAGSAKTLATVTSNTITGFKTGVKLYQSASAAEAVTVTINGNNEIKNCDKAIASLGAYVNVTVENNPASIHGNTVGVDVASGVATINNNHIYNNGTGIQVAAAASASVTNNDFDGGSDPDNHIDVSNAGTLSAVTDNDFAASRDSAPKYVVNTSANNIDATDNKYSGADPSLLNISPSNILTDNATLWAIENKLVHHIDNVAYGFIRVKTQHVFVTHAKSLGGADPVITRGVGASVNGDIVNVQDGTYGQPITVNKMITLVSADGTGLAKISNATANILINATMPNAPGHLIIDGFTVQNGQSHGITVKAKDNASGGDFTIQNCTVTGLTSTNAYAIAAFDSIKGTIVENAVTNNSSEGILVANSQNINVTNCTVSNNRGSGILAYKWRNNSEAGTVSNMGTEITNLKITNCVVEGNGRTLENANAYGVFITGTPESGVAQAPLPFGKDNQITSCTIRNNAATGIWLTGQNVGNDGDTMVIGNDVDGNGTVGAGKNTDGIKLRASENVTIKNNYIRNNVRAGVLVASSSMGNANSGKGTVINFNHISGQIPDNNSFAAGLLTQIYTNPTSSFINANDNWWGHVYGPVAGPNTTDFENSIGRGDAYENQGGKATIATWYGKVGTVTGGANLWYALNDRDGDGIKDADEDVDLNGSYAGNSVVVPGGNLETKTTGTLGRDSDGDTYEDGVEVALGYDPRDAANHPANTNLQIGSTADSDNDGYKDSYEVAMKSNPNDINSKPKLGDVNGVGGVTLVADLSFLRQILVGSLAITAPTVYADNMDMNRDGAVSNIDAIGMRRFIEDQQSNPGPAPKSYLLPMQ